MKREANEIEKEYWMNRKQKIKALMHCYGFTRKEADQWLRDGRMKRKKAKVTPLFLRVELCRLLIRKRKRRRDGRALIS